MTSSPPPDIGLSFPRGWYCVAFSADLPAGAVLARRLADHELVVYRTASGRAVALDAYCPHLGAHLAVGGTVEGETVRCPFHGFRFDPDGRCVATGYGGKVPPTARVGAWWVTERNGLVLAWFSPAGEAPTYDIPEADPTGFTAWRTHCFTLRGHPQEVVENSVDLGHLAVVHGYRDVTLTEPVRTEGALLRSSFSFERPRPMLGQAALAAVAEVHQWGLGYALVEVDVRTVGLRTRQLVLPLPVGKDRLELRIAMAVHEVTTPRRLHPLLTGFPFRRWLAERIADLAIRDYVADVSQDVGIWNTKAFLPRPALAEGDGPIGAYRNWTRQFYARA